MRIFKLFMTIVALFGLTSTVSATASNSTSNDLNKATYNLNSKSYEVEKRTFTYVPDSRPITTPKFTADIYFSQAYFEHSSYVYDEHLATTSFCLAVSTFQDYGEKTSDWYYNQSRYLQGTLETIGFNSYVANSDYRETARFDTIGLGAAKREFDGYTVIAVAPRSGGYYSEWANNVHLGDGTKSDYMHEGWYNAANKLINFVSSYITTNNVTGRVKLWLTGFSRGGATANLAAGLLDARINKGEKIFKNATLAREDVYAYTFEAPQGANVNSKTIPLPKDAIYNNIFNIVNPNDLVPKLAMSEYGFTRFGIDKFITTRFYDPDNYEKNRRYFKALYDTINQNDEVTYSADNFVTAGLKVEDFLKIITIIPSIIDMCQGDFADIKDNTKANYDANIALTLFLEELTSNIGSRKAYVKDIQTPIENLMLLIMDEKASELPSTASLIPKLILVSGVADCLLGNFVDVEEYLKTTDGKQADVISKNISALIGPLTKTYWERPNELISIMLHLDDIFQNHFCDVTFAHVQLQDSYYVDAYNASHSNKIEYVAFRENADFGRMKFFGFNDLGLRLNNKKGKRVVNVEGHVLGKSDIEDCDSKYAVGYYSYITEEKMELFMPINTKYNISMKSYSKKPRHRCEYWAYYQFIALDNRGKVKIQLDHKKDTAYFNSDRFKRDVTISI